MIRAGRILLSGIGVSMSRALSIKPAMPTTRLVASGVVGGADRPPFQDILALGWRAERRLLEAAHQPIQGHVTCRRLVVQLLQDNRGGDERSRVGPALRQLGHRDLWYCLPGEGATLSRCRGMLRPVKFGKPRQT